MRCDARSVHLVASIPRILLPLERRQLRSITSNFPPPKTGYSLGLLGVPPWAESGSSVFDLKKPKNGQSVDLSVSIRIRLTAKIDLLPAWLAFFKKCRNSLFRVIMLEVGQRI
jgi:hypothetical protein